MAEAHGIYYLVNPFSIVLRKDAACLFIISILLKSIFVWRSHTDDDE